MVKGHPLEGREQYYINDIGEQINKLGFHKSYYECGSHPPYDSASREKMVKSGIELTPLYNNCSGKHAGMLALAKHLNVDPNGYTKADHPVQQRILELTQRYTGIENITFSIDGCSAVAPFFSLRTIALLFQKLTQQDNPEMKRIYQAMINNPYLIAGKNRFDTDFIKVLNGRGLTKIGGEAVRGIGIKTEKHGVVGMALKVLDGSQRCLPQATLAMLNKLNILTEEEQSDLAQWSNEKRYNHRKIHIGDRKIIWE